VKRGAKYDPQHKAKGPCNDPRTKEQNFGAGQAGKKKEPRPEGSGVNEESFTFSIFNLQLVYALSFVDIVDST